MRKILIIAILAFISGVTSGQKYVELYNEGIEFFKQEKYKEADSLISLAITNWPKDYKNQNVYFDRGVIRLFLLDTSGFCYDMKSAAELNDREAKTNYMKFCLKYNNEANKYYNQGFHEFILKNYKSADSLLTLSIESYEFVENIYLRGIVKFYMLDTNSFCSDMEKIYYLNDQANQNFQQICKTNESQEFVQQEGVSESEGDIYFVVEEMPTFKGKNSDAFRIYIQQNLRYPIEAMQKGIQGRVYVQFDVDHNGKVKNVKIEKSAGEILDNEALRVVKTSPKWRPGLQRGKQVTVRFTFPIVFQIK